MPMYPNKAVMVFDNILIQNCSTVDPIHLYVFILSGVDLKRVKGVLLPDSTHPKKFKMPFYLNRSTGVYFL